jgi:L-threonylcarbamoyladenylate synthase
MTVKSVNDDVINEAAELILAGECVAIPTETVYGLAASAVNKDAVNKIFKIKNRPKINPLISHFNSLDQLIRYVDLNDDAVCLAQTFWPGPMTLIVNRPDDCQFPDNVTAGLKTIAVRIPSHPTAQKIIAAAGVPLAAPSANLSGEVSPTSAIHVSESLGNRVPLIIADGASKIGLESTVVDVSQGKAIVLRAGSITTDQLSDALGYDVEYDDGQNTDKPKSPGQLLKHYAPKASVRLRAIDVNEGEALLAFGSTKFIYTDDLPDTYLLNLSETGDLDEAASNLFSSLRKLDTCGASKIAVMDIPNVGIGIAINDRLKRAAQN